MDSSNSNDQSKRPNAPPPIELDNNDGSNPPSYGQLYSGNLPSMQTTVIPPVSNYGSIYPPHQPTPMSLPPYLSGNHNSTVSAAYPPAPNQHSYGYPPAVGPMSRPPYPIQMPNTPKSDAITNTTSEMHPSPYPPAISVGWTPYPPQVLGHPPTISNQAIGLIAPPIGMTVDALGATDARHYQDAPPKRVELGNPTVRPVQNFNPHADAELLRETLQLEEPDKDVIINILCHRSLEQRLVIANRFSELSHEPLVDKIKSKFEDNFQRIIVALLTPLIDLYVRELHESLEYYDHDSTIDIMCLLSNYEMYILKYMYQQKYGVSLESELESKTSVHFKKLLLGICACSRDESGITNLAAAQYDAGQLALKEDPYNQEESLCYVDIFRTRNFQQIKLITEEYQKRTGQSLEDVIKGKFLFDDKQGYLCIVRYSLDKYEYFAKRLHRSMDGMGTNDNQLIRLIVTRCEIDLQDIKDTFRRKFGKSLRSWIKGDTSGYYKYCLYELIGEKRSNKETSNDCNCC